MSRHFPLNGGKQLDSPQDPRLYMAAERTFLAWIRTGIALMGFGFIVARFDLFLRELALVGATRRQRPGFSLCIGVGLIVAGILVNFIAPLRHRRDVRAIDTGQVQPPYRSK